MAREIVYVNRAAHNADLLQELCVHVKDQEIVSQSPFSVYYRLGASVSNNLDDPRFAAIHGDFFMLEWPRPVHNIISEHLSDERERFMPNHMLSLRSCCFLLGNDPSEPLKVGIQPERNTGYLEFIVTDERCSANGFQFRCLNGDKYDLNVFSGIITLLPTLGLSD
jgi:hypothetical protein